MPVTPPGSLGWDGEDRGDHRGTDRPPLNPVPAKSLARLGGWPRAPEYCTFFQPQTRGAPGTSRPLWDFLGTGLRRATNAPLAQNPCQLDGKAGTLLVGRCTRLDHFAKRSGGFCESRTHTCHVTQPLRSSVFTQER